MQQVHGRTVPNRHCSKCDSACAIGGIFDLNESTGVGVQVPVTTVVGGSEMPHLILQHDDMRLRDKNSGAIAASLLM